MPTLPDAFLTAPIAHRAFHDVTKGRPENSRAAIEAAIAEGYGIEIDVQLSADHQPMVFHDYGLGRLTGADGPVRQRDAETLGTITLSGGDEGIPTLGEVLKIVDGRVPLLVEIKDQDGSLGPDVGPLESAVAAAIDGYGGELALMSFNPHAVAALSDLAPLRPRGLVTCAFEPADWPVPEHRLAELRGIPDVLDVGASFISHDRRDLDASRVADLKRAGLKILTWTIKSPEEEAEARKIADNITFEGYPARPFA